MSDVDFAGLRQRLEEGVRPPAFAEIRARRRRRTQWWFAGAAACVAAAVLAGTAVAVSGRHDHQPQPPAVTPSPSRTAASTGAGLSGVLSLAGAPSGALFVAGEVCTAACAGGQPVTAPVLLRTADLGGTWSRVGTLPGRGRLAVVSETLMWLVGGQDLWRTTDGGRQWSHVDAHVAPAADLTAVVAGSTVWLYYDTGARVLTATGAGQPAFAAPLPARVAEIRQLVPIDDRRAVALGADATGAPLWYGTDDKGAHWSPLRFPCPTNADDATLAVGPDGTRWVVCAAQPGAGRMAKQLVLLSAAGTVAFQAPLESDGYAVSVAPVSGRAAWRWGGRADVYRTTDRRVWTDAAPGSGDAGGPVAFVARDADTDRKSVV